MKKCEYDGCSSRVSSGENYCAEHRDSGGDFGASMLVGGITNSALLGGLIGGDMAGGIVGDLLNDGDIDFI